MYYRNFMLISLVIFYCFVNSLQDSIKVKCVDKLCIAKCCPENEVIKIERKRRGECYGTTKKNSITFSDVVIYDRTLYKTNKSISDVFDLVTPDELKMNFSISFPIYKYLYNLYLSDDGTLTVEEPNGDPRKKWFNFNSSHFCIENIVHRDKSFTTFYVYNPQAMTERRKDNYNYIIKSTAMTISCMCLALVITVYMVLPSLRDLRGLVVISYVGSLFLAYVAMTINLMITPNMIKCKSTSFMFYFFFLSGIFWMNIMSFDIWWTLRGLAKYRKIHRRGEIHKYLMYCLYAWGVPCMMTVGVVIINEVNMRHMPWLVTPKIPLRGCFFYDLPRLLYLYVPMMVLLLSNLVFFIMTVYNIWRLSRGMRVLQSAAAAAGNRAVHLSEKQRFIVYLKLSAVMGINWILEVVSSFNPDFELWYLTDIYNLIIGVIIFVIFVCNRKIWKLLRARFHILQSVPGKCQQRRKSTQDTSDSECSSPEDAPKPITYNTKGSLRL